MLPAGAGARTSPDDVTAGVALAGTLGRAHATLYSDPVMEDAENHLVPAHRSSSGSGGRRRTATSASAAFELGLQRAGPLAARMGRALGLEDFRIDGEDGRLVAGSRLSDRLWLEYAYGLEDRLGTLLLRVQLTEHALLEAASGSGSALDLVYSLERE